MGEWIIVFQRRDEEEDNMVIMPSIPKLLLWIAKNGSKCCEVSIRLVEG